MQFLDTGHHVGVMWLVVQNYEATPWPVGHRLYYCVIGGKLKLSPFYTIGKLQRKGNLKAFHSGL